MKLKKTFLFFCILFLLYHSAFSQQKIDSTNYYHTLIKKSKKASELILAYKYFGKEKKLANTRKHYLRAAYFAMQISNIQNKLGQYYDSETSAIEGLKYLDSVRSPVDKFSMSYKGTLFNRLGVLKRKFEDYEESFNYYSKFLEVAQTKSDSAIAYNNIGIAYKYLKENSDAKLALEKAYIISKELNDQGKIALTLGNLGYIKALLGEEEGISDMKKALEIRIKNNDSKLYESYKNIVDYYRFKRDTIKALYFARKGYKAAKRFNSIPYIEDALYNLIKLKAYNFIEEYMKINDSIKSSRMFADNKNASYQYNYAEIELEREREKSEKIKEQSKKIFYQIIGGSVLLVSILLFFVLRARHKKEKLRTQFDTERQISKKLHDEVANDVFSMMSRLQSSPNTEKEIIDNLEEVYLKTRDISKTHAAVDVTKDFDVLLKDLIATYKTTDIKIFTRNISEMPWKQVANLKKEALYRVIQELMTNMKKHSKASLVTLQFEEKKNIIMVTYVDNGVGCELNYGNGLQNAENRMGLAGGAITFESEANKGFQAKIIV